MDTTPIQIKEATEVKYLPYLTPMTCQPVAQELYKHQDKWWEIEWYGTWLIREWLGDEQELHNTREEAVERARGLE